MASAFRTSLIEWVFPHSFLFRKGSVRPSSRSPAPRIHARPQQFYIYPTPTLAVVRAESCDALRPARPAVTPHTSLKLKLEVSLANQKSAKPHITVPEANLNAKLGKPSLALPVLEEPSTPRRRLQRSQQVHSRWKMQVQCIWEDCPSLGSGSLTARQGQDSLGAL